MVLNSCPIAIKEYPIYFKMFKNEHNAVLNANFYDITFIK